VRDALEFEWMGKPSVVVVADALTGPADAMLRVCGVPDYPYIVTPFPVGNLDSDEIGGRADTMIDDVVRLLCDRAPAAITIDDRADDEQLDYDDLFAAIDDYARRGWTDGLPIVPPTRERVDALLRTTARAPDEVVVTLATRDGLSATIEQIAINAAMAGCWPEHFPVVLATMDAMADPRYNLHAHTATMAGAQQVIVVNGPIRHRLAMQTGNGALGPGWPANNAVGRGVRLVIRNILRSVHGEFDRAGFSHPGRFGWCIAEDDENSPWPVLAQQGPSTVAGDATSVYATVWQSSIINHERTARALVDELTTTVRTACAANWLHHDAAADSSFYAQRPFLFVTGREHARVLTDGGIADLDDLRAALYDGMTRSDRALRPVAIAGPQQIYIVYVHASGMQQTWFFAPFQSHNMVTRAVQPEERQPGR
jgi:hypothetical protein